MVHHRLGDPRSAGKWLEDAARLRDQRENAEEAPRGDWMDWLRHRLLLKEAEDLIKQPGSGRPAQG
jgi:hypothetical protein